MRVLVTGVAGFIGSHLAAHLAARGDEVFGLDCFDETLYPAALHQLNLATVPQVRFTEGSILDVALVENLIKDHRPDVVVHLAALAGVRPSLKEPARYQRVNVEGTTNIFEACRAHGATRIVFASSSSVYGSYSTVPFSEAEPADRPASPYAASKRAGELLASNFVDLYGLGITALRFFTVYGPRQRPEMAIAKFARLILDGKPLPLFGDGSTARDYTFIDDIVDGVVAAIDRVTPGASRVYNLGGSRTTTLSRLVELLEERLGKKALITRHADQPGDVPITYANPSLAAAELGWSARIPIEEGLVRVARWLTEDHTRGGQQT